MVERVKNVKRVERVGRVNRVQSVEKAKIRGLGSSIGRAGGNLARRTGRLPEVVSRDCDWRRTLFGPDLLKGSGLRVRGSGFGV